MASYFFDTSAAVKYYHFEAGTLAVSAIFAERGRRICMSSLGLLEIQSALALKVRSGILHISAADLQRAKLMADVAAGDIEIFAVTGDHFLAAGRLIGRHSFVHRLRTLDALQLAVVLDLSERGQVDTLVVADQVLASVAASEGLRVLNPSHNQLP